MNIQNNITLLPDGTKLQLHKNGSQVAIVRVSPLHRNARKASEREGVIYRNHKKVTELKHQEALKANKEAKLAEIKQAILANTNNLVGAAVAASGSSDKFTQDTIADNVG